MVRRRKGRRRRSRRKKGNLIKEEDYRKKGIMMIDGSGHTIRGMYASTMTIYMYRHNTMVLQ